MHSQRTNLLTLKVHLTHKIVRPSLTDPISQAWRPTLHLRDTSQTRAHQHEFRLRPSPHLRRLAEERVRGAEKLDGSQRVGLKVGAQGRDRRSEGRKERGGGSRVGDEGVDVGDGVICVEGADEGGGGRVGCAVEGGDDEGAACSGMQGFEVCSGGFGRANSGYDCGICT